MDDKDGFQQAPDEGMVLPAWERRDEYGFLNALYLTIRQVLLDPGAFFSRMPTGLGFVQPLLFALAVGVIGFFLLWMWNLTYSSIRFPLVDDVHSWLSSSTLLGVLWVLSPIWIVLSVFTLAGVIHGCLALLNAGKMGFEATFRVTAYGYAALLLLVVPVCGSVLVLGWGLTILSIGIRKVHDAETWRAVAAVAVPALFCLLGCGGMLTLGMGLSALGR